MTSTIDDLLADAYVPTTSPDRFDVGAALRRLAADAARNSVTPSPDMVRAARAGQRLSVVSRWILNGPGAAEHIERLAVDPEPEAHLRDGTTKELDVHGALVFACLLHLTGHPESAQFWWQLAAGASSRAAAYCLHLHHLQLGESREARHWYHQLTHSISMADGSAPPDDAFIEGLETVAHYVRANGSTAYAPTGGLEGEVDRLASRGEGSSPHLIVRRPDQRLADQLHRFTGRH
ncbi:hypothetical protein [Streptomyces lushanensis]|uniref:hypothetical protein n=1 Tax=Streptomyces lushanensis TaxID=1434255 RepID=UPI00082F8508|nr:hypothetical protein [Streptomyces lushanensis]